MRIFNMIIEIITSPFSFFFKTNVGSQSITKFGKPWIILILSVFIVLVLVLILYRAYIFQ